MLKIPEGKTEMLEIQIVSVNFDPGQIFGSVFVENERSPKLGFCTENETEYSVMTSQHAWCLSRVTWRINNEFECFFKLLV